MCRQRRAEELTFAGADGASLSAWFLPGTAPAAGSLPAAVVLSHGFGGTHREMLPAAFALNDAGLAVLVYDLRGCGRSSGHTTYGAREVEDLRVAVDVLAGRPDVDGERIGALGFSMGAATTVMAAARDPRIRAVAADSGWADVFHWLRPGPRGRLRLGWMELRSGVRLNALRPERVVADIAPRPLLIVHGTGDDVVPCADARLLFAAAGEPKDLWLVDGAAHGETIALSGTLPVTGYADRLRTFFTESLGLRQHH